MEEELQLDVVVRSSARRRLITPTGCIHLVVEDGDQRGSLHFGVEVSDGLG